MSTIKSSNDHLTLSSDGSNKDIKFQANGVEKASISSTGAFTSTTIDATKLTGTIPNFTSTGIDDNANSTAITINANENVGIEVTPKSWEDNYPALQIGGKGALGGHSGSEVYVMENAYRSGGNWKHIATGASSQYVGTSGKHKFKIASSGSADANISWTDALEITNDGRGLSEFTAMAWANVGLDNVAAGNSNPGGSLNVSSVTLNSTGNAVFNFTNNISSASVASLVNNNTAGGTAIVNGTSTSGVDVTTYHSNGNAINASLCNMTTHGGS